MTQDSLPFSFSPDFRKTKLGQKCTLWFCCRCQKEIKDTKKAIPVTVDWNNWIAVKGHDNNHLLPYQHREIYNEYFGSDCWKKREEI